MKKELFDELVESLQQAGAIHQGTMMPARTTTYDTTTKKILHETGHSTDAASDEIDVQSIRAGLHLSQRQFAALLGISIDTLQNWEHRRNTPSGPAKALLRIAAKHPAIVLESLE